MIISEPYTHQCRYELSTFPIPITFICAQVPIQREKKNLSAYIRTQAKHTQILELKNNINIYFNAIKKKLYIGVIRYIQKYTHIFNSKKKCQQNIRKDNRYISI